MAKKSKKKLGSATKKASKERASVPGKPKSRKGAGRSDAGSSVGQLNQLIERASELVQKASQLLQDARQLASALRPTVVGPPITTMAMAAAVGCEANENDCAVTKELIQRQLPPLGCAPGDAVRENVRNDEDAPPNVETCLDYYTSPGNGAFNICRDGSICAVPTARQ